jgi:hypothetical protein
MASPAPKRRVLFESTPSALNLHALTATMIGATASTNGTICTSEAPHQRSAHSPRISP